MTINILKLLIDFKYSVTVQNMDGIKIEKSIITKKLVFSDKVRPDTNYYCGSYEIEPERIMEIIILPQTKEAVIYT